MYNCNSCINTFLLLVSTSLTNSNCRTSFIIRCPCIWILKFMNVFIYNISITIVTIFYITFMPMVHCIFLPLRIVKIMFMRNSYYICKFSNLTVIHSIFYRYCLYSCWNSFPLCSNYWNTIYIFLGTSNWTTIF